MKLRFLARSFFAALLTFALVQTAPGQQSYKDLKFPPLKPIKMPKVKRTVLPNGMIVLLVEDHELPLVEASMRIGVGGVYDPADKVGLASITGEVMRTGGSTSRSGDEIDDALEQVGAVVEVGIGRTSGYAAVSALKEHADLAFGILADILEHPAFPEDKIELAKIEQRSAIARRNDDPMQVIMREFTKLIYGADSPYARHPEYATIDCISRADLVAFHRKFFHPNNVILGVWGDFKTDEMIAHLRKIFGGWEKVPFQRPSLPQVKYTFDYSVNYIEKPELSQSYIMLGHIGGIRKNPDYFTWIVLNEILGGGFSSRLVRNVRSRMGLAYSVFGAYGANYDYPGMFYVGCQTKLGTTVKAIRAMLQQVKDIRESGITDDELKLAKEIFLNSFVFNFDTKREIVERLMTYEYYGYPKDFLTRIRKGVEKVTKEDVQRVARKYLHPDKVRILVEGNQKGFDEPLSVLGKVNTIDITIPEPKEETPKASKVELEKGQALLAQAAAVCGGEKLKQVRTIRQVSEVTIKTPQGDMAIHSERILAWPDRAWEKMTLPMGSMTSVTVGNQSWMITPKGVQDVPAERAKEARENIFRELPWLLRRASDGELTVQALGQKQVEGKTYDVLLLRDEKQGFSTRLYLDPATHKPLRQHYRGRVMGAPTQVNEVYEAFRTVDGVAFPVRTKVFANGKEFAEAQVDTIQVNVRLPDSLFQRPSR